MAEAPLPERVQSAGLKSPSPENLTEPEGVIGGPAWSLSVTVAVHVVPWLIITLVGEHATERVTVPLVTVTVVDAGSLVE